MMQQDNSLVEYGARRVIVTITAIIAALLEIVDTTIVNVALTDMKGNLGATLTEIGWVVTAYAIGNVIVVPMTSWLSQQFGRRNYFAASIMIFTTFSFLCGNATGIWELVIFRFCQGLGGGALLVTSQTIITESYPIEKRGMSQAIYGLGVIIGPTLGPPLGGYIVDHFSWPYIFYINIPIGIVATLLTLQFVRSPKFQEKTSRSNIDFLGMWVRCNMCWRKGMMMTGLTATSSSRLRLFLFLDFSFLYGESLLIKIRSLNSACSKMEIFVLVLYCLSSSDSASMVLPSLFLYIPNLRWVGQRKTPAYYLFHRALPQLL
jgi:MFS family permease